MKKILPLLFAGAFVCALCGACDTNDETEIIQPVTASAEVAAFFQEHTSDLILGNNTPTCVLINSTNDFTKILPPSTTLPAIDFNKHTLVVGQHLMDDPSYRLESQHIKTGFPVFTLNLTYERLEGVVNPCVVTTFFHWALYPKFKQKQIITIIK